MPSPDGESRQFVQYAFFKATPEWRLLPEADKARGREEFAAVCYGMGQSVTVRSYTLVGIRGDVDFLLWNVGQDLESLHSLGARLRATGLGRRLETPYHYLGMTRRSVYVGEHRHEGQEGTRTRLAPQGSRYLFVYPFVKTRAWYALPAEERQRMMNAHFAYGHSFPSVRINTSYSYGLDDQEFMLAFETDRPSDFLDLVIALRETEASSYTERDTPIFTCISAGLPEVLESLG